MTSYVEMNENLSGPLSRPEAAQALVPAGDLKDPPIPELGGSLPTGAPSGSAKQGPEAGSPRQPDVESWHEAVGAWHAAFAFSVVLHGLVLAGFIAFVPKKYLEAESGGAPMIVELVVGLAESAAAKEGAADNFDLPEAEEPILPVIRQADTTPLPPPSLSLPNADEPIEPVIRQADVVPPPALPPPQSKAASAPPPAQSIAVPLPPVAAPDGLTIAEVEERERRKAEETARERHLRQARLRNEKLKQEKLRQQKALEALRVAKQRQDELRRQKAARDERREARRKAQAAERLKARREALEKRRLARQEALKRHRAAASANARGTKGTGSARSNSAASTRGGTGGTSRTAGRAAQANHKAQVLAHLARHKRYPAAARDGGVTGLAVVSFQVSQTGQASGIRLARSSGSSILDQAALSMVRRAVPFPRGSSSLSIRAGIRYNLQ